MNHFTITNIIRKILLQNEQIKKSVEDRIFPIEAPKNTTGDFIIYQRDGYAFNESKMGVYNKSPLVFINIISDDYDNSQALAGAVYDALIGSFLIDKNNPDSKMKISLEDSTEEKTDKKFMQILLIKIDL